MSWFTRVEQRIQWSIYHKFGRVHFESDPEGTHIVMDPRAARDVAAQLVRWADEADKYQPVPAAPPSAGETNDAR